MSGEKLGQIHVMLLKCLLHSSISPPSFWFIFETRTQVKIKQQNERDVQYNSRDFKLEPDNPSKVGEKYDPTTQKIHLTMRCLHLGIAER